MGKCFYDVLLHHTFRRGKYLPGWDGGRADDICSVVRFRRGDEFRLATQLKKLLSGVLRGPALHIAVSSKLGLVGLPFAPDQK